MNIIFNENIFISFEMLPRRKFIHANNFRGKVFQCPNKNKKQKYTRNYATKNGQSQKNGLYCIPKQNYKFHLKNNNITNQKKTATTQNPLIKLNLFALILKYYA